MDLRIQVNLGLYGAITLDDTQFGGVELNGAVSIYGAGAAVGLGYEQYDVPGTRYHGGVIPVAAQLRFLTLIDDAVYRWVDPHIDLGWMLGGGALNDEAAFRGSLFVGFGIDFLTLAMLSVQYRFQMVQTPDTMPAHLLMIGIGARQAGP